MKKITPIFFAVFLFAFTSFAQPQWVFDKAHSNFNFSLVRLMVSDITGSFQVKEASLMTKGDDFTDASAHLVLDMSSIDTDVPDRDTHLQSPSYFDAVKYPEAVFNSTSFKKTGDKKYTVMGDLTMHGITKPATFEITANPGYDNHGKKEVTGMRAKGTIKRSDFGIDTNTPPTALSDEISITANLVFVKN